MLLVLCLNSNEYNRWTQLRCDQPHNLQYHNSLDDHLVSPRSLKRRHKLGGRKQGRVRRSQHPLPLDS